MSLNREDARRNAQAYRLFAATKPHDATPSRTFVNSVMKGPLTAPVMASPRSNANDNLLHASFSSGAQIVRV